MTRRKRLDLDERRAQLLAHATLAFSQKKYDEVSIDDLAQAAGVSKGLLYHYFPSKRDLYVDTVRAAADELMRRAVPDTSLSPREQVLNGVDRYLQYVEKNAAAYVSLMQGIGQDVLVQALVDDVRRKMVGIMVERMGEGLVTPAQRLLVRGWVGMVEAASLDWLQQKDVGRDQLTKLLVATLAHALQLGASKA